MFLLLLQIHENVNNFQANMGSFLEDDLIECIGDISNNFLPKEGNILITTTYNTTNIYHPQQVILRTKRSIPNVPTICSHERNSFKNPERNRTKYIQRMKRFNYDHKFQCDFKLDFKNSFYKGIESKILKNIHSISSWTITVDDLKSNCSHESERFGAFIFIIAGENLLYIQSNQILMSNLSLQKAKIMIIILGTTSDINRVFIFLNKFSLRNSLVLYHDKNEYLKILTWPSDDCGNLKPSPIYSSCVKNKYILNQITTQKVNKSIRKCQFYLRNRHNPPFSIHTDIVTAGIDLKVILIIANKLDIEIKFDEENVAPLRNMFILSRPSGLHSTETIKYMPRYYTETYMWVVPRSASHPHWSNITNVFKLKTWLFILLSLIFISTTMKYVSTSKNIGILKFIFTSWGVLLNISIDEISGKTPVRIIFITWILVSIALTTVFQAFMTSFFTDPGSVHQINTFNELEQTNLKLLLTQNVFVHNNVLFYTNKPTFFLFTNDCQMLECCFRNSSVAALTTEERFLYMSRLYFRNISMSLYHTFKDDGISFHRTLNMYARNPFVEAVNKITISLVEGGIVDKIVEHFLDPSGWIRGQIMGRTSVHDYAPLSMFDMTSPFMYLVYGYLLCIAVFVLECVIGRARKINQ
ncbi:hypothetical protein L9F63_018525 [Diploptera punctata]|uniref:Uncharacterized protein n=1 Tax=Diploptera punctata TaxID=6984 RepID=A0AAD7ZYE0_DIPPU|nr:hypothetical protein L9F63_018525 [Diploptera punctata]